MAQAAHRTAALVGTLHRHRAAVPLKQCIAGQPGGEPTLRQSSGVACTDADTIYVASLLSGSCCWYTVTPFMCLKVVQSSQFRLSGRVLEEFWKGSWLVSDRPSTRLYMSF